MKFGIQLFALLFILFLFILVTYYVKKNKRTIMNEFRDIILNQKK